MRVGLDVTIAAYHGGLRTYARQLTANLAALGQASGDLELCLFYNSFRGPLPDGLPHGPNVHASISRVPGRVPFAKLIEDRFVRPMQARNQRIDLYHSLYLHQPTITGVPRVMTVHDVIPLLHPELFRPAFVDWFTMRIRSVARWADRVLVYSLSTQRDLQTVAAIPDDRIDCVPLGVDPRLLERPISLQARRAVAYKNGLLEPFFLYLGEFEPRKNLLRLVEAYGRVLAASEQPGSFPLLALAGRPSPVSDEVSALARKLGIAHRVRQLGSIPDADVAPLMAECLAFLFPSLYEGFGLPPLEAMACGVPVMGSLASSVPEVMGDAGLLVDPLSVDDIAQGLHRLATDEGLRSRLKAAGRTRSERFTWTNTAARTAEVYERTLREWRQHRSTAPLTSDR